MTPGVLIVEDEAIVAFEIEQCVRELGYRVIGPAASADEALDCVSHDVPTLALMDVRLTGDVDGTSLAVSLRDRFGIPSIFLTANSDAQTTERAQASFPAGFVTKPFDSRTLKRTLKLAMDRLRRERADLGTERLRALQVMAGGVAHEVNNPLAAVSANLAYLRDGLAGLEEQSSLGLADLPELRAALADAANAASRIARTVADLLRFSAEERGSGEANVRSTVEWAARATEVMWLGRADLRVEVSADLFAPIDERPLAQVLVQLLTTAAQAVREAPRGAHLIEVAGKATGTGLELTVTDSGVALSRTEGTVGRGLPLSLCQGLVEATGGKLTTESPAAGGCRVTLTFDRMEPAKQS